MKHSFLGSKINCYTSSFQIQRDSSDRNRVQRKNSPYKSSDSHKLQEYCDTIKQCYTKWAFLESFTGN